MAEQSISFYNATQLPPDVAARLKQLEQQEQVAKAMMARGMQPVEPVQGKGALQSVVSPFQGISSLVNAYFGAKSQEEVGKGYGEAAQSYQTGSQKALEDYLQGRQGAPAHGPIEGAASPSASTPADPFGSAVKAAGSVYPMVHQLGMADLQQQLKGGLTPEDILKLPPEAFTSESKIAAASAAKLGMKDPWRMLQPKPEYLSVGGAAFNKQDLGRPDPRPVVDTRETFERNPDGTTKQYRIPGADGKEDLYQREVQSGKLVKMDPSTKVSQTTTVEGKQETAAAKKAGDTQTEEVAESAKSTRGALKSIATTHQALQALDTGNVITGFAATPRLIWNRIAETIGVAGKNEQERLSATQQLIQSQAQSELDASYQMQKQGQITEAERELLRRTASGNFGMSAPEIRARLEIIERVARWRIEQHENLRQTYQGAYKDVNTETWKIQAPPAYRKEDAMGQFRNAPPGAANEKLQKYDKYRVK